ncbi:hypothetical protein ACHAW6_013669 [Cyclotella cf. meneghiniana]
MNLEENKEVDFHIGGKMSLIHPSQKKEKKDTSKNLLQTFGMMNMMSVLLWQRRESINCNKKDSMGRKTLKFTIRGKPLPLVRHRSSQGFMYNPSGAAQEMFRDSLLRMLPQRHHPIIIDDDKANQDDRQVVSLKATKMLDLEGMCEGATDVTIMVLEDEKVNST